MRRFVLLLAILGMHLQSALAQEKELGYDFFPAATYFEVVLLDPSECQVSIGVHKLWEHKNGEQSGVYIPGSIGFRQSFIRYVRNAHSGIEIGMSAGAFAQFSMAKVDNDQVLAEMLNTDYKAAMFVHYRIRRFDLRMRLFHISSHLSDDYIYRHQIMGTNNGQRNFEQLDFTVSLQKEKFRYYGGMGMVITPNAVRRRFSSQLGVLYRYRTAAKPNVSPVLGLDLQMSAQNNLHPNMRTGLGVELGNPGKTHIAFLLEYYYGHIPYGTVDYGTIQWLGISTRLLPPSGRM